jgi:hypothetical protein
MLEILAGLVTLLVTVLPVILQNWGVKKTEGEKVRETLVNRDLTKLRADLERVRSRKTRPLMPQ